jgi:hypothetical protein
LFADTLSLTLPEGCPADRSIPLTIITNYDELTVDLVEPSLPEATRRHRRRRLEELAWQEFAFGGRTTTTRSAMARAARRYVAEYGLWVKNCVVCGSAFASKRSDAQSCTDACRKRQQRGKGWAS